MDPALKEAAKTGDVKFLKVAFSKQPSEYFLTQCSKTEGETVGGNIFHLAAWSDQVEFIRESRNILPIDIQKQLLFQVEGDFSWTPLHAAAVKSNSSYEMVKVMKQMYASISWDRDGLVKPWLALTLEKMTPLHHALKDDCENEKCAMEILLMDPEYVSCTMFDENGNTPLIYALKNGFNLVAEKILKSPLSRTAIFRSTVVSAPFTYATGCSENVVRLLFKTCGQWMGEIDTKGYSVLHEVLHEWAETGEAEPCKLLLEEGDVGNARTKIFRECIFEKEKRASDTPLHLAARRKDSELGQILVRGYHKQVSHTEGEKEELMEVECPPWKVKNILGNTPLHSALYATSKHEELALEILSIDPTSCKIRNNKGESPFFLAVKFGCSRVVDAIMRIEEPRFDMIHRNDRTTVIHCLSSCPEDIGRRLLNKYWWVINMPNDKGNKALDYASQANTPWLVNLLTNPSLIQKEDFDWIEACKREETAAILAFVDYYQDLESLCREKKDTPLHHIKLSTYKEYLNFLKIPSIAKLKNNTDHDDATPLHRALEREDINLAKVLLLDDKVERTIANNNDKTSMHLLAMLCKENDDWKTMCELVHVNPYLKGTYSQLGINLDQTRSTLSVVAALLATITFAAGFTLPGGINSETGKAVLINDRVFSTFLIGNAYAMCSSMLTLFLLTLSMTVPTEKAWLLVQRSLLILAQSLYATMITFSLGIFLVIPESSKWVATVISTMCTGVGSWVLLAYFNINPMVFLKLIRALRKERQRQKPKHDEEEIEIITSKDEEETIQ